MLAQNLIGFVSVLSAVASASPLRPCRPQTTLPPTFPTQTPQAVASSSSSVPATSVSPTLPSLPGATQLPGPSGLTLKHVALGHGIQNYTCAATGVAGNATGALAVVYDITALFPGSGSGALDQAAWDSLTAEIVNKAKLPLNMAEGSATAASGSPFPAPQGLDFEGLALPFLGHHYFDATGKPTFDLMASPGLDMFVGTKAAGLTAPSTADPGPVGTGAVAWLQLTELAGSRNIKTTYRVVTAGGNSETCTEIGQKFSVPYTAQYWFYD